MNKTLRNVLLLSIVVISTLMHLGHFSKDLMSIHVWRQSQTQSTILNFYEEDMNILNPRINNRGNSDGIFRMEFPLMQWLVACQYKIFGKHLIITRFFMFIVGLFSVLGIYKLLYTLFHNTVLSLIGAWAFNFSPSFYYYTINPMPDNLALCCSIWGLVLFFNWYNNRRVAYLVFSSLLLATGALCKLPFIIYYIVPGVYFLHSFITNGIDRKNVILLLKASSFSILPVAWYFTVMPHWKGNMVVKGMLANNEPFIRLLDYYHHNLISTMPELLVGYGSLIFFFAGFFFLFRNKAHRNSKFLLLSALGIITIIYYLFEANAIGKIHDYYLFPFYPVLFILVAYGAFNMYSSKIAFNRYLTIVLILAIPVACYLRMQSRWDSNSPGYNKDLLIYKNELRNAVPKNALVVAGNDDSGSIFLYHIDKKGWSFGKDNLTLARLRLMINNGAEFLYTDSDVVVNNTDYGECLDSLILQRGSIKIYKLKSSEL